MSDCRLEQQVVVITGGAGTLGRAFGAAILAAGGTPVLADIDGAAAEQAAATLNDSLATEGVQAESITLDMTDTASVRDGIAVVTERHGRLDGVINNAYVRPAGYGRGFFDLDYQGFTACVSQNLGGYFLVSQQAAQYFQQQGHGALVNIGSIYGLVAPRFDIYDGTAMTTPIEYAAIKAATVQMTEYLAKYLAGHNIRVNAVCPGGIFAQQPASFLERYRRYCLDKGMLDAADIAGAVVFLLSDASRYINGQTLAVDDGFTL